MVLNSIYQMMNFGYLTLKMIKNYVGTSLDLINKMIEINENRWISELDQIIKIMIKVLQLL